MWENLKALKAKTDDRRIIDLFDDSRAAEFSLDQDGLFFDYSKTNIDAETKELLVELARNAGVESKRKAMMSGEKINDTEGRAVLHTALRNMSGRPVIVDNEDVMPGVRAIRDGAFRGQGGQITDVVNIGIGGSDLGPAMATLALAPFHDGPVCHFVSNVDGANIADVLQGLNPQTTLVIVASKTFTTIETMTNAETARDWMAKEVKEPALQFAALSSATDKTSGFGIPADQVFGFEDWVGGRYSVWGPIGLSLMLAIGTEDFGAFLAGASAMDTHFSEADLAENMPVLLALVGVWHNQVCGFATRAVLPYDQRLSRLPAYLQQLEMESNGKSVAMDGTDLPTHSGPVVWGEPGTNGQHAFYQLIHQGTRVIPCEFLVAATGHEPELSHQHDLLVANCFAQSEALMQGRSLETALALMAGNRPSTTLLYSKLTPFVLGQIIALYEHRVFVEGVILGLNSFDQWGVELGKELAVALTPMVTGEQSAHEKDGSTQSLLATLTAMRAKS
ncbi:UNVERIFIED_CONTAM: hypothetical protein GTU68_055487 [Idotea baltica]|nr:hypothetical protein [Idotea baltica]